MAFVEKRCRCGKVVESKVRICSACGGRVFGWRARHRGPDRREHSKTFAKKSDAERHLAGQTTDAARGVWVDAALGRLTLAQWSERWLATKTAAVKPKTIESYASLVRSRILPGLGAWSLAALRPSDIQAWIGEMHSAELSASRIRQAHVVLSLMLAAAVREGLLGRNVATGTELPRLPSAEAAYFEPSEVERIALATPEPYDLLVRLMGTLGLRFGEAAALRRRSVDLLRRRLVVEESMAELSSGIVYGPTKSHAARRVPLTATLVAAFDDQLAHRVDGDPAALVFKAPNGGPLRHSNFYSRLWRPALAAANLPAVGVHVLRHSAAAALIASGASPKAVQTILGHRSAAFTLTRVRALVRRRHGRRGRPSGSDSRGARAA